MVGMSMSRLGLHISAFEALVESNNGDHSTHAKVERNDALQELKTLRRIRNLKANQIRQRERMVA